MNDARRDEAIQGLKQANQGSFKRARDRGDLPGQGSGHRVFFTTEQWAAIQEAIDAMVRDEGNMTEARALELMAAEFFAGAGSG